MRSPLRPRPHSHTHPHTRRRNTIYHVKCKNKDCPHIGRRTKNYWSYHEVSTLIGGFTCMCGSELEVGERYVEPITPTHPRHPLIETIHRHEDEKRKTNMA